MRACPSAACVRRCGRVLLAGALLASAAFAQGSGAPSNQTAPAAAAPPASGPVFSGSRAEASTADATMTLHVYAAHVQIPALVLTPSLEPVFTVEPERFRIRLDSGRPFLPSSVRLEGEDPINMAVLFDAAGSEADLLAQLTPALIRLRAGALHAQDSLYLYAVDCSTVRYTKPLPLDAEGIEHAVKMVLEAPALHGDVGHPACGRSLHIWDTMASAVKVLAPVQGRRVLLALTTGADRGSRNSWANVHAYASAHSVAVFALTAKKSPYEHSLKEDPLWEVSGHTGGLLFPAIPASELAEQMNVFVSILRHRYILEFARSNKLAAGGHTVDVEVEHTHDLVRVTGLSVPILEKKVRDDPTTVPYMEADRPEVGERRSLNAGSRPN